MKSQIVPRACSARRPHSAAVHTSSSATCFHANGSGSTWSKTNRCQSARTESKEHAKIAPMRLISAKRTNTPRSTSDGDEPCRTDASRKLLSFQPSSETRVVQTSPSPLGHPRGATVEEGDQCRPHAPPETPVPELTSQMHAGAHDPEDELWYPPEMECNEGYPPDPRPRVGHIETLPPLHKGACKRSKGVQRMLDQRMEGLHDRVQEHLQHLATCKEQKRQQQQQAADEGMWQQPQQPTRWPTRRGGQSVVEPTLGRRLDGWWGRG